MENIIEVVPVMLAQNKTGWNKGEVITITEGHLSIALHDSDGIFNWQAQHMYFTSNGPIKEGDWYLTKNGRIYRLLSKVQLNSIYGDKKIEASTDPSLNLPSIPSDYIREYVKANGKVGKARLALERVDEYPECAVSVSKIEQLKLTDNNEVVIAEPKSVMQEKERGILINGQGQQDAGVQLPDDIKSIVSTPFDKVKEIIFAQSEDYKRRGLIEKFEALSDCLNVFNHFQPQTAQKKHIAIKIWESFEQKIHDEKVSKEMVLHHLKQLKAQMGKLKSKNDRFPHMELAYNDAIIRCMGAIDQKIEKIKNK